MVDYQFIRGIINFLTVNQYWIGCLSYNVDEKWINYLKTHKCVPRVDPSQFAHFHITTAEIPILSWNTIRNYDGVTNGDTLWIVINHIVLEFVGISRS